MRKSSSPYVRPAKGACENGVNIDMYGFSAVYTEPPELNDEHIMQMGNKNPIKKIKLKKSGEIKSNYIGACTNRIPRVPEDCSPIVSVHNLIDGDVSTCWSSRSHSRTDDLPIWLRIDIAKETKIDKIIIKKRPITFCRTDYKGSYIPSKGAQEIGRAMVKNVTIKTSCDAYEWKTHFDGEVDRDNLEEFVFDINGASAKQILIVGKDMDACENWIYSFSVACIEVIDMQGRNIALHSKGAAISTNSTRDFGDDERGVSMYNWLLQADLGFKWARMGYHDDPINWHWVEREKGVLKMDPLTEDAIDMLVENGVNIVYCLNFGNRLYEGYKERRFPQLREWYYETPYPPTSETALKAWDEYVKFSVNYFKDRVAYFEIWNEWNGSGYWGDTPNVEQYISLAKRTIKLIREISPDIKIMMGSFAQFIHDQTPETADWNMEMFFKALKELASEVDAIGYHPFYQPDLCSERYLNYTENVYRFKKYCEDWGFKKNVYMASEFAVGAMYPTTLPDTPGCWFGNHGRINYSEIEKAKVLTQLNVKHSALGIQSILCALSNNDYPLDLSLLRMGYDSHPVQARHPGMAYYVARNTCTIMDGYEPAKFNFNCSVTERVEAYSMEKDGAKGVVLWTTHEVCDDCEGIVMDVTVDLAGKAVRAYNMINGEVVELNAEYESGKTIIRNVIVRDVPVLIEIDAGGTVQ